ncbi:ATP-binding cassette domain-containing protein [Carboxydochorda subterranea]|uniref:ATP-binding cassette domain-containing protein n=1 Tax=Carboxydichorda subterranea TaxID=3109565 RepID=A0ABZ1BTJ0_9FIRM|nr:ATP-binding cassette domain-containing protein [Limnochorda sp. L945t]WRP16135.1 ATP-binding cassette domain-containing protein [Limnochorda sp. L945t]
MALEIEGLVKHFGAVRALDGVTFEVPEGTVFGLIGPNGAGKTTTMRAILRILEPDGGSIRWKGRPIEEVPPARFGYLPEERGLYPRMRVRDELAFFGELRGLSGKALRQAIDTFVELLHMQDIIERKVDDLSKGNAQKVQFAAACLHDPELLVLDEPFSGLDPVNVRLFMRAFRHMRERGATILFSSHRMEHVEQLCDALALIARGRVLVTGAVEEVRRRTGRRVLRLAWETPGDGAGRVAPGDELARWLEELARRDLTVRHRPQGVVEVAWQDGAPERETLADELVGQASRLGRLRLFELTYPSLESVYVETVGAEAVAGEEEAR